MITKCLDLILLALLLVSTQNCESACNDCNSYIDSGQYYETCSSCAIGYSLNSSNSCELSLLQIIAISIVTVIVIAAQIIVFIYCKRKYQQLSKKKSELTLEDIYKQQSEAQQKADDDRQQLKTEFKIYIKNKCGICHKEKTSIRTSCGHYFHHECFKENIKQTPDLCPNPSCLKRGLSPIEMICSRCLSKKRSIPLESISNYQYFKEYFCISCKLKNKKEQEANKWWKKIFK